MLWATIGDVAGDTVTKRLIVIFEESLSCVHSPLFRTVRLVFYIFSRKKYLPVLQHVPQACFVRFAHAMWRTTLRRASSEMQLKCELGITRHPACFATSWRAVVDFLDFPACYHDS